MTILLSVLLVAGLFAFLIIASRVRSTRSSHKMPAAAVPPPTTVIERHPIAAREFFSKAEYRLWSCLRQVVPRDLDMDLLSKVRWEDVWRAERGSDHMKYRGFLRSRHVDFALYDRAKNRISLLIELNDRSHQRPDRKKRDERLKEFCLDTDTPLLILFPAKYFDQDSIRQRIQKAISEG